MSIEIKISKKRIPYKVAMRYLNKRVEEVKKGTNRELLWILEHPTTYTAGVSFNKKEIIDNKIKIIKSNRGGKITLHNPCLLYTSPSPRDLSTSRMPSSA